MENQNKLGSNIQENASVVSSPHDMKRQYISDVPKEKVKGPTIEPNTKVYVNHKQLPAPIHVRGASRVSSKHQANSTVTSPTLVPQGQSASSSTAKNHGQSKSDFRYGHNDTDGQTNPSIDKRPASGVRAKNVSQAKTQLRTAEVKIQFGDPVPAPKKKHTVTAKEHRAAMRLN